MDAQSLNSIKAVSPELVSSKLIDVVTVIYNTITPVIYPLALLGYAVAFIFLIGGAIFHSKTIKKMGGVDFCVITLALIFYFSMPVFIGLLKTIQNVVIK
ncbi:hypothetical protein [Clostridium felsineum]|uniref:hypothetical protein n=1 Tax=Clostridium felsineum TaxID=36839 RepID=UPI0009D261F7|nr:hypothetical protein [Clostridium felsineum]URZ15415.1 hypothetical protein CLFE_014550 [Clostridium felsineum DSM 794]